MIRSKTLQDPPQDTAKATPPQDHFKTVSHSYLGLDLVLNNKPGTNSNTYIYMYTILCKIKQQIAFSIGAKVRNRFDSKAGNRPGTKSDWHPTGTTSGTKYGATSCTKSGDGSGARSGTRSDDKSDSSRTRSRKIWYQIYPRDLVLDLVPDLAADLESDLKSDRVHHLVPERE